MAEAAKALGYEYLAITDHSKSQVIANGLSAERLLKHIDADPQGQRQDQGHHAAGRLRGRHPRRRPAGLRGRRSWRNSTSSSPARTSRSSRTRDKATDRLLRAIDNRYVNVIGHPTGRLINRREGLPLDFDPVIKAAADNGTALEINAGYPRLDLNESNARAALDAGVMLSINTDAHSTQGFGEMSWASASPAAPGSPPPMSSTACSLPAPSNSSKPSVNSGSRPARSPAHLLTCLFEVLEEARFHALGLRVCGCREA